MFFSVPIIELTIAFVITPILSKSSQHIILEIFLLLLFIACICRTLFKIFYKNFLPSPNSLIRSTAIIAIYLVFFRFSESFIFYETFLGFAYADFLIGCVGLYLLNYQKYADLQIDNSWLSLVEDTAYSNSDILGRDNYAKQISYHIDITKTESSFGIAIVGAWGTGKTDFLIRLKNHLRNDRNVIIDFNPWRVNKQDAIVEEFFYTMSTHLNQFNDSLGRRLNEYSKRILQTTEQVYYKLADVILNDLAKDKNLQDQYEELNAIIKQTGKRFIVILDDIDRLSGREVMEVLRLIRNGANFANTFFIVAADHDYLINVLANTKDFTNEEQYLKKVFQLVISLPAYKKIELVNEAKRVLVTDDLSELDRDKINSAFYRVSYLKDKRVTHDYYEDTADNLFEKMIDNPRDLKRFCNSFKIAYSLLKDETDIHDLFVLELIRNRNIDAYNLIKQKAILNYNNALINEFIFDKATWDRKTENRLHDKNIIESAIEYLLHDESYKNARKFRLSANFYIYFSYQLFDKISLAEFNGVLKKDYTSILTQFNEWLDAGLGRQLTDIVTEVQDFENAYVLYIMIKVYCCAGNSIFFSLAQQKLHDESEINLKKYFNNNRGAYSQFINRLLNDDDIDAFIRGKLAKKFLDDYIFEESSSYLFLSKEELHNILLKLFSNYLHGINEISFKTFDFLALNVDKVAFNKIILEPDNCSIFRRELLNRQELFKSYVKYLLWPYRPYTDNTVFEPWLGQIFLNYQDFKHVLEKTEFDDRNLIMIKSISLKYIDKYFEDLISVDDKFSYKPFYIKDQKEREFVTRWCKKMNIG
jgi:KAP family P-loop domain.